jgi:uncharacterized membrane-anchored protein YitT (DUF2179 family)
MLEKTIHILRQGNRKQQRLRRILFKRLTINYLLILAGAFSASFALKSFLLPNGFIDGGVTGISMLVADITNLNLSLLIITINIPFIILGFSQIGKNFVVSTIIAISTLAIILYLVSFPFITSDKLLVSIFGGFFLGLGIGLSVRGGGVIDGTEILALYISKKTSLSMGDVILIINIIIFSLAAFLLGIDAALYSILTYLAASKTVDFVITGIEEYTGVTIVSDRSDDIRTMIIHTMGRGVTIYKGERGYGKRGDHLEAQDVVFTVITRLEVSKLKLEIEKIDPSAFVVMHSVNDTKGGMIKKRPLH